MGELAFQGLGDEGGGVCGVTGFGLGLILLEATAEGKSAGLHPSLDRELTNPVLQQEN